MNDGEQQDGAGHEPAGEQGREPAPKGLFAQAPADRLEQPDATLEAQPAETELSSAESSPTKAMLTEKEQLIMELRVQLEEKQRAFEALADRLWVQENQRKRLESTVGWKLLRALQNTRGLLTPPGTRRDRLMEALLTRRRAISPSVAKDTTPLPGASSYGNVSLAVQPVGTCPVSTAHLANVDIIVCVHDVLLDVRRCLESVAQYTKDPYRLILVDDGSADETQDFLAQWATAEGAQRLRNEPARGYTYAANQGLRLSTADYALLLNSDTIVTPGWLDRMVACAESEPRIGVVGPLSNTASWQSIPDFESKGDWASNPLPPDTSAEMMAELLARDSARLYPWMPFLNGFCLLIKRQVLDSVGYFDEECFGAGYGEENDYALRARSQGWQMRLADDADVYHAQSKSYSTEARRQLSERAFAVLVQKHSQGLIDAGVHYCRQDRTLRGIRARAGF